MRSAIEGKALFRPLMKIAGRRSINVPIIAEKLWKDIDVINMA